MQPLNYCRQLAKQCMERLSVPSTHPKWRAVYSQVLDLHKASQKFMLPDEGQLLDDPELRAIDENDRISLPYEFVALEYFTHEPNFSAQDAGWEFDGTPIDTSANTVSAPKRVVFARHRDEDWIAVTPAHWSRHDGTWNVLPEVLLPRVGYMDRTRTSKYGRPGIMLSIADGLPTADYLDEITVLLGFLNALQCSNVGIERHEPRKTKAKSALPFDSYHVLVIGSRQGVTVSAGGTHRSPREHLRRGHIRRLQDGRKVWVNATVVRAGRGAGVVSKDYALRQAA